MMTLVESKSNGEITKKSIEGAAEIQEAIFVNVPVPFVEAFVLKNPGDYCVSKNLDGIINLSIVANGNKERKDANRVINLRINQSGKEFMIPGMMFARAESLPQLICQLKYENIDILGGVLDEKLSMDRLLGPPFIEIHNIHMTGKLVTDHKLISQDPILTVYTGELEFADGKIREVLFEEVTNASTNVAGHKVFFEKLVNGKALGSKNLPIRLPIGAILNPPTLIYENNKIEIGTTLGRFLKDNQSQLDLIQRIKMCSSTVRILSELHQSDIYHGASQVDHFYVDFVGFKPNNVKNYELVFNGTSGLLREGKSDNSVSVVDYDSTAPEVSFTRKLTKESGVFNLGRLFEAILKPEMIKSYHESNQGEPPALNEMRVLISRATHPNPTRRPTMNGIVIKIRDILLEVSSQKSSSSSPINIIHFDQFTKN